MYFVTLIARNLLRRRGRSLLTIIGLAVGVGAVVSLVGLASSFQESFLSHYTQRHVDLIVQRASTNEDRMTRGVPEQLGPELAKLPGVKQVVGRLLDQISFANDGVDTAMIEGWPADSPLFDRLKILKGKRLAAGDKRDAMLGFVLAANLEKKIGDEIKLYDETFVVAGIFESPTTFENGGVIVLLNELQTLMNVPNELSGFAIAAEHPIDERGIEDLRVRIEASAPGIEATTVGSFVDSLREVRISRAVAWLTSAIAIIIGGIGMLNTMTMSVSERAKEIGMLRAIGWRRTSVVQMILGESIMLSVAGALVGSAGGAAITKLVCQLPNVSGWLDGNIGLSVVFQGFLVALVVGGLGGLFPAIWSANLLPTEALRR